MGLSRAFDRAFFVMNGSVKQGGGSLDLAKGQLALVDSSQTSANGLAVLTSAAGKPKNKKDFQLRIGVVDKDPTRSYTNKDQATMPFSLEEIVGLKVDAPKITEHIVDEVIIGYDGMNDDTAFNFRTGDAYFRLSLELKGGAVAFRGGKGDTEMVNINVEIPNCDPFENCVDCDECADVDCRQVTLEAIERIKEKQLTGGQTVGELIDVTPVFGCDTPADLVETPWDYYCLEICDTGSDEALALVQAQYPDYKVIRTDRVGSTSKYQVLLPNSAGAPADFDQTLASFIKGCEDCPAGWTASPEGVLYAFTIEDDGVDLSATFSGLPGYVAGTVTRADGNNAGVGFYTAILDDELTSTEIDTLLTAGAPNNTITLDVVGNVAAICSNATVTSTAWTACGTCNVISQDYTIVIPDDSCGNPILETIQANYDTEISIAQTEGTSVRFVLSGTSGDGTFTIGTNTYSIVFNTDVDTTGADFVAAHASSILYNHNITVSYDSGTDTLTFAGPNDDWVLPAYAQDTADLNAVAGAPTTVQVDDRDACQTRYQTSVVSDIVCEECDPIFKDYYITEAPEPFELYEWEASASNPDVHPSGNCKCGIRFKAKVFVIDMEESLRDLTGFVETSTQIRVAAGYPEEIREGIGRLPEGTYDTKYLSKWQPRTHLAGHLRDLENESRAYFRGIPAYRKDYLGRLIMGETTNMEDQIKQYVQYTITIDHANVTQSFAGRINEKINYDIFVEVGRHNAVEALLNNLASAAGVPSVQAFGA